MQYSRLPSVLLALFAFSLVAYASPVSSKEVAVSARDNDQLTACLNILLDAKVKIDVIIAALVKLDASANITVLVGQIVAIISACATAIVNVGVIVDLSDTVQITAIATVCAQIIVSIQACITVFASILVNLVAVVNLDLALQVLLLNLQGCISGILVIIAPLCVNITVVVNLSLPLVISLLGLGL
ncbi:hypothetical protein AURDEDRAFT_170978 [Auricularia subglabra TFB-10046 SS5]|nr:hypothetical protein AURDEDRAFT_170978 [Auricularia subglabra TFB-10046 SS5]